MRISGKNRIFGKMRNNVDNPREKVQKSPKYNNRPNCKNGIKFTRTIWNSEENGNFKKIRKFQK